MSQTKNGNRIAGAIMAVGMTFIPTYMEVNNYDVPIIPRLIFIGLAASGLLLYIFGDD